MAGSSTGRPEPGVVADDARPPGGQRVFSDDAGRRWRATLAQAAPGAAFLFTCLSDPRRPERALDARSAAGGSTRTGRAGDAAVSLAEASDAVLRAWLDQAPEVEQLT